MKSLDDIKNWLEKAIEEDIKATKYMLPRDKYISVNGITMDFFNVLNLIIHKDNKMIFIITRNTLDFNFSIRISKNNIQLPIKEPDFTSRKSFTNSIINAILENDTLRDHCFKIALEELIND